MTTADDTQRFMAKVQKDPSGCWMWAACRQSSRKYGSFYFGGRKTGAHRASYELFVGPIPAGFLVRHQCDTPLCVNPEHLLVGTHLDNSRDCITRGRINRIGRKGSANGRARLTEHTVKEIRALYSQGARQTALSEMFGVSQSRISAAILGTTWRHVS